MASQVCPPRINIPFGSPSSKDHHFFFRLIFLFKLYRNKKFQSKTTDSIPNLHPAYFEVFKHFGIPLFPYAPEKMRKNEFQQFLKSFVLEGGIPF